MKKEMESPTVNKSSRKHDAPLDKKGKNYLPLFSAYHLEEGK
jgi:hypothetical protein